MSDSISPSLSGCLGAIYNFNSLFLFNEQSNNFIYKTKITKGVVMMCSKDNYYQEFVIEGAEFQKYKHNFLRRVDEYYSSRTKTSG